MIKGSKKTDPLKRSLRDYYLICVDGHSLGVCTNHDSALSCIKYFAGEHSAEMVNDNVYLFNDASGTHVLSINPVKRLRVEYK